VRKPGFGALVADLTTFIGSLARHVEDYGAYLPLAAE